LLDSISQTCTTLTSPLSPCQSDRGLDNREPDGAGSTQCCPHPGCNIGSADRTVLKRHYRTHFCCADVSDEDVACVCCTRTLGKISAYNRTHANCVANMKGQLSRSVLAKALKQRQRITEFTNKKFDDALPPSKRARKLEGDDDETSCRTIQTNDVNTTCTSDVPQSNSGNAPGSIDGFRFSDPPEPDVPNLSSPPREPGMLTREGEHAGAFLSSIDPSSEPDLYSIPHSTAQQYTEYLQGSAMVENPMDGPLVWDFPTEAYG